MTIQFAPEKETKVETIADVQELLSKKYKMNVHTTPISDLDITEEYHILYGSKDYEITQRSLAGLLRRLGIPPRFGLRVPEDLLDTIVRRLREVKPQNVKIFEKSGTIYGVAPERYEPPDMDLILEPLNQMKREVKMCKVCTDGVRIATIGPQVIYPRTDDKKDAVSVGIYMAASITGRPYPFARLMTYRHICTNGVITGKNWGEVRWPKGRGIEDDQSAESVFITSLTGLVEEEKKLLAPVKQMANSYLMGNEFSFLWKALRKTVGQEEADKLLQASDDERRQILATAKLNRKQNKTQERVTVCSAYEAFNNISERANRVPGALSEKLQRTAGVLLERGRGKVKLDIPEDTEEDENA